MPPPFGTGSPSSTTRGLYSLLENGPEQWASTRQQTAAAARRPTPKPRLESCRPIRPPASAHPCGTSSQDCGNAPVCARTHRALAAAIGSLPPHIAVRSRQEWGWFVPPPSKQRRFAHRRRFAAPPPTEVSVYRRRSASHALH